MILLVRELIGIRAKGVPTRTGEWRRTEGAARLRRFGSLSNHTQEINNNGTTKLRQLITQVRRQPAFS